MKARRAISRQTLSRLIALALSPLLAYNTPIAMGGVVEDEISGFTIDNTITRIGHNFTRFLSDYRHQNYDGATYNLTVHERPSARWGNLIWVTQNNKTLYRRFVQPNSSRLQQEAEQAAQQIHEHIKQVKLQALFADTFDLERDEF